MPKRLTRRAPDLTLRMKPTQMRFDFSKRVDPLPQDRPSPKQSWIDRALENKTYAQSVAEQQVKILADKTKPEFKFRYPDQMDMGYDFALYIPTSVKSKLKFGHKIKGAFTSSDLGRATDLEVRSLYRGERLNVPQVTNFVLVGATDQAKADRRFEDYLKAKKLLGLSDSLTKLSRQTDTPFQHAPLKKYFGDVGEIYGKEILDQYQKVVGKSPRGDRAKQLSKNTLPYLSETLNDIENWYDPDLKARAEKQSTDATDALRKKILARYAAQDEEWAKKALEDPDVSDNFGSSFRSGRYG